MKHSILTFFLCTSLICSFAQEGLYLQIGAGLSYSNGNLAQLTTSLSTYEEYAGIQYDNDPMVTTTNLSETSTRPSISLQGGFRYDNLIIGLAWYNVIMSQEADYLRQSGYGRTFAWEERRNDILVDFGYNLDKIAIIGSLGSNINNFTMTSYQRYPDGSKNLDKKFTNNGVFRAFDAGFTYGLGVKIVPLKYVAVDIRYYNSLANLVGEPSTDILTLTDNSFSRNPGTTEFPADWNRPRSFDNSIAPDFQRSFIQATALLTFSFN